MKTITYKFADGTKNTVEVADELYLQLKAMTKTESNKNRAETRRHVSLDSIMGTAYEPSEENADIQTEFFGEIQDENLRAVLSQLTEKQQELLYDVVVLGIPQREIAERENMSVTAVNNRFIRIIKKFQTFFARNVDF